MIAIHTACQASALASLPRPDPSARATADKMPPPMAPAEIITNSICTGKTSARPANASVPSLAMK